MANSYQAHIKYEEATIKEMDKALQNTFHFGRKILLCAISLLLLGFGVRLTINNTWGLILIILGCFIAPYGTFYTLPGAKATASIDMLKGKSFYMAYDFQPHEVLCRVRSNSEPTRYTYHSCYRLIDTGDYVYLCINQEQACMVDTRTLQPDNREDFMAFVAKKAGLEWTRPYGWLNLSLRTIRRNRANTRKEIKLPR